MTDNSTFTPDTQIMNATTPVTVDAAGNLLQYDALLQGYRELLEQAKKQLEDFEITDQDWQRLGSKVARSIDGYFVAAALGHRLRDSLGQLDVDAADLTDEERADRNMLNDLIRQLSSAVLAQLQESVIRDQIRLEFREMREGLYQQMKELRDSYTDLINSKIEIAIKNKVSDEVASARVQADALETLIQRTFGQQFRRLAKEAAAEVAEEG